MDGKDGDHRVYTNSKRGDYQEAIEYHEKRPGIAKEIGCRAGQGAAYGNLGNTHQSLGGYQKAIEHYEKHLKIAKEIGDRAGEGRAYENLGNAYQSLGDYQKTFEYHEKILKIAKEIGEKELPIRTLDGDSFLLNNSRAQLIILVTLWKPLMI